MECPYYGVGDNNMFWNDGPLIWGYRLLWVLLVLGFLVTVAPTSTGMCSFPTTLPFIGALVSLTLPLIFSKKELLEYDVHKCTLVNLDAGIPKSVMIYLLVHELR